MAKSKAVNKPTEKKENFPEVFEVEFIKEFEGNINDSHIKADFGEKKKVNKLVYDFCKKHGVIK